MRVRQKILCPVVITIFILIGVFAQAQDNTQKFKLKPGASGKLCLNCHGNFQEKLKKSFVHTPLKKGDCTGCHNPHTSSHGKLLASDTQKICSSCHETMIPSGARSTHKVVVEGNCMKCHDP